jgi:hypothetical protein
LIGLKNFLSGFIFFLILNFNCSGQEVGLSDKITINIESGSLQNALQKISDKSGVSFAYRQTLLRGFQTQAKNYSCTIDNLLNELLTSYGLCYTFQNKQIIIHTNCLPKHYTISGTILEDSTLTPLPYVAITLAGTNFSAIADQNGYFELEADYSNSLSNLLVFSSMGFQGDSLKIIPGECEGLTLTMKPKSYDVPEVIVHVREYFIEKIGNTREHEAGSLYLDTHGQQTALLIKNRKRKQGQIKAVEYYLSDDGNTDAPFRIRIYEADSNGMPAKDLIEDAIVVKPQIENGWYTLNIENLQLKIPENGLFIAIEGVYPDDYDNYFGESEFIDLAKQGNKQNSTTLAYGQRIGYNRKCRKDTWHYSMSKVWFQLDKQSFGVMISAVVKYEKNQEHEISDKNE